MADYFELLPNDYELLPNDPEILVDDINTQPSSIEIVPDLGSKRFNLPNEIMSKIFGYLTPKEALPVFWVCHLWALIIATTKLKGTPKCITLDRPTNMISRVDCYKFVAFPKYIVVQNLIQYAIFNQEVNCIPLYHRDVWGLFSNCTAVCLDLLYYYEFPPFLSGIKKVGVNNCENITQIGNLQNTKYLTLWNSPKVVNLYNVPNLKILELFKTDLYDFSSFAKLKKLKTVSNCNADMLLLPDSLSYLTIVNASSESIGQQQFNFGLELLHIANCSNLVSLENFSECQLNAVNIMDCPNIVNLEPIKNVNKLNISGNMGLLETFYPLRDRNMFKHLTELVIKNSEIFEDVSFFRNLKKLEFHNCSRITQVNSLENIETLILDECANLTVVRDLSNIQKLDISGSNNLIQVQGLRNISYIDLRMTPRLISVSDWFNIGKVDIAKSGISDIEGFGQVKILNLSECHNISNFNPLLGEHINLVEASLRRIQKNSSSIQLYNFLSQRLDSSKFELTFSYVPRF